ncbi:MAG: helix-turn-helix transcriptional regulator [Clostridia bacterium]|nr:helix-turn-helix transcriptional regulator [Clostridia bacterium]
MKLCEKISLYRKKCGLSQEALAEKIGVSRQAVSKWETGDALPEVTKLKALAECFGVTVDFLLDDEADEYKPLYKNKETTGVDRFVEWIDTLPDKLIPFLKKHSVLVGVAIILFGILTVSKGLPSLLMTGHIATSIAFPFMLIPIIYVVVGVAIIIAGIIAIKKLKRK